MTALPPRLDHLVVLAADLEQGVAWAEATLGVTPGPGGEHPLMGTHNRLLRIAHPEVPAWQRSYLEIIAINPRANNDQRTLACRWFDMDSAVLQAQVRQQGPQLIHWVAQVSDVRRCVADLAAQGVDRGAVTEASRHTPEGLLRWHITVRPDGQRLYDGALPTLIQWGDHHPSERLPECGLRLLDWQLHHPEATALNAALRACGLPPQATEGPARLQATLQTPNGPVTLASPPVTP